MPGGVGSPQERTRLLNLSQNLQGRTALPCKCPSRSALSAWPAPFCTATTLPGPATAGKASQPGVHNTCLSASLPILSSAEPQSGAPPREEAARSVWGCHTDGLLLSQSYYLQSSLVSERSPWRLGSTSQSLADRVLTTKARSCGFH